jgi:restriction endonuclease
MVKVFEQARNSESSFSISDSSAECYIDNGVKICRDLRTNEVTIYNTMRGGDYYEQLTPRELNNFEELGWEVASVMLNLSEISKKRSHIKALIENDNGERPEQTKSLLNRLNQIQERWNRVNTKLSLISA